MESVWLEITQATAHLNAKEGRLYHHVAHCGMTTWLAVFVFDYSQERERKNCIDGLRVAINNLMGARVESFRAKDQAWIFGQWFEKN